MKHPLPLLLATSLTMLLAACHTPHSSHVQHGKHTQQHTNQTAQTFACDNGLIVEVRSLNNHRIAIQTDNRQAILSSAVAASGERYVSKTGLWGYGGEWHQKGKEALFGFKGVHGHAVETTCQQH